MMRRLTVCVFLAGLMLAVFPRAGVLRVDAAEKANKEKEHRDEHSGQEVSEGLLRDWDYRFQLKLSPSRWSILPEKRAQAMSADAIVVALGISSATQSCGGLVIAEEASGATSVEAMARQILDQMTLGEKKILSFKETSFLGQKAFCFNVEGKAAGLMFCYCNTVFLRKKFLYQVLTWGKKSRVGDHSNFREFKRGFSFLEGDVRVRSNAMQARDARGPGWRVKDGVFSSSAFGFKVSTPRNWRLVVGGALQNMDEEAEIGLQGRGIDTYLSFIPEWIYGIDKAAYAERLVEDFSSDVKFIDKKEVTFDGERLTLRRFHTTEQPYFEYWHGVYFRGNLCLAITNWHRVGASNSASALLPEALASFEFLKKPAWKQLWRELQENAVSQRVVGSTFSVRNFTYRSFMHGLIWRYPRKGIWRVLERHDAPDVGPEAKTPLSAVGPRTLLEIEEVRRGVVGELSCEALNGKSLADCHTSALEDWLGEEHGKLSESPVKMKIGGKSCLSSVAHAEVRGLPFRYRIVTGKVERTGVHLVIRGLRENMEKATECVDEAVRGLSFPGRSLEAVEHTDSEYKDWRVGFSLTPPDRSWTMKDVTPPEMRALGAYILSSSGERNAYLIAFHLGNALMNDESLVDLVRRTGRQLLPGIGKSQFVLAPNSTLSGRACLHCYWKARKPVLGGLLGRGTPRLDNYILTIDGTLFYFVETHPAKGESLKGMFKLLD